MVAHLGAREDVQVSQIGRGGLGKLAGRVVLPGTAPNDGGEQLHFRGHGTNSGESWRRFWVRHRGEKGAGECGELEQQRSGVRGREREIGRAHV